MASDSQTGLGTRLENSKYLLSVVTTYPLYSPILTLIKTAVYGPFIDSVETSMTAYNKAKTSFDLLDNVVEELFVKIVNTVRSVRNVLIELYGIDGEKYLDYNEIIDVITGDNVSKNTAKRKKEPAPENPEEDFQSVAQLDRGSRLAKFTLLIDALEADPLYLPAKAEVTVAGLKTLRDDASAKNTELAVAYATYTVERAKVLPMFDGPEGLTVRAERAKAHVRSVYGAQSPELKALTGRTY